MDGLTDDYECWSGELPETLLKDETAMYVPGLCDSEVGCSHIPLRKYQTEAAATVESHKVVVLPSGAWKT